MVEVEVSCPMSNCVRIFDYECENESAGDGSEHKAVCPGCNREIHFEIVYEPIAGNETYKP